VSHDRHIDDFARDNSHWLENAPDTLRALAVSNMLAHEVRPDGVSFVDHPNDPGGATNYGISLRFLDRLFKRKPNGEFRYQDFDYDGDGDVDADDMRRLPVEVAILLYQREFWDSTFMSKMHPRVAIKYFDMCVNMGPRQATLIVQRAINETVKRSEHVLVDGVFGEKTLIGSWHGVYNHDTDKFRDDLFLEILRVALAGFYRGLVDSDPDFAPFLTGWLRRAAS